MEANPFAVSSEPGGRGGEVLARKRSVSQVAADAARLVAESKEAQSRNKVALEKMAQAVREAQTRLQKARSSSAPPQTDTEVVGRTEPLEAKSRKIC